jgi:hypothetical protein
MAKTRRKKINKSPLKAFQNSRPVVVEQGFGVKTAGYRAKGKQVSAKGADAKAIHIGRVYTGVPRGKTYPYSGPYSGAPRDTLAPRISSHGKRPLAE